MSTNTNIMEDMEGEYENSRELLLFLKDQNPTLKIHVNDESDGMTFFEGTDVVDALEHGRWIHMFDPTDTVSVR